jgi:creatinine amidohydrolase
MMLALRPDLVHMARAKHFVTLAERSAAQFPFIASGDGVRFGWQTQDLNEDGACGDATQASAAKGEQVIAHVAERFIAMLGELDRLPLATLRPGPLG